MKKCLNILLIFFLCFFVTGCTGADDFCTKHREWSVMDVSLAHQQDLYDYNMKCVIEFAFKHHNYNEDTYRRLIMLEEKFNAGYMSELPQKEKLYKKVIYNIFLNIFEKTATDVEAQYLLYKEDTHEYLVYDEFYFSELFKYYDAKYIKIQLNKIVKYFETMGYFKDYHIADLFYAHLEELINIDRNRYFPIFEDVLSKVAYYKKSKK